MDKNEFIANKGSIGVIVAEDFDRNNLLVIEDLIARNLDVRRMGEANKINVINGLKALQEKRGLTTEHIRFLLLDYRTEDRKQALRLTYTNKGKKQTYKAMGSLKRILRELNTKRGLIDQTYVRHDLRCGLRYKAGRTLHEFRISD